MAKRYVRYKKRYSGRPYSGWKSSFQNGMRKSIGGGPGTYDGIYKAKIIGVYNLVVNAISSDVRLWVNWAKDIGADTDFKKSISNRPEFAALRPQFRQYRIQGLKIQVDFIKNVTSTVGSWIGVTHMASDISQDQSGLAAAQVIPWAIGQKDYKSYSSLDSVSRYYNVASMLKGKNINWLDSGVYGPECGTMVHVGTSSTYVAGNVIGQVTATWYVWMKGWHA